MEPLSSRSPRFFYWWVIKPIYDELLLLSILELKDDLGPTITSGKYWPGPGFYLSAVLSPLITPLHASLGYPNDFEIIDEPNVLMSSGFWYFVGSGEVETPLTTIILDPFGP